MIALSAGAVRGDRHGSLLILPVLLFHTLIKGVLLRQKKEIPVILLKTGVRPVFSCSELFS
jgi:hypothetical protein